MGKQVLMPSFTFSSSLSLFWGIFIPFSPPLISCYICGFGGKLLLLKLSMSGYEIPSLSLHSLYCWLPWYNSLWMFMHTISLLCLPSFYLCSHTLFPFLASLLFPFAAAVYFFYLLLHRH